MKLYYTYVNTPEPSAEPVWDATIADARKTQKRLPESLAQRGRVHTDVVHVPTQTKERRLWVLAALNGDKETMHELERQGREAV